MHDDVAPGCRSFVNVHVTVSPAWRLIDAGSLSSEHVALVSCQPAGTVSDTEYVPGVKAPESFCWPSESWKGEP